MRRKRGGRGADLNALKLGTHEGLAGGVVAAEGGERRGEACRHLWVDLGGRGAGVGVEMKTWGNAAVSPLVSGKKRFRKETDSLFGRAEEGRGQGKDSTVG